MRNDMVGPILTALRQQHGELTAGEAASLVGRSLSRMRHQFTVETGMSFRTARLYTKLAHGLDLLRTTDCCIPDISAVLGYSDRTKFEKAFKRLYGVTPAQYRADVRYLGRPRHSM